MFPTNSHAVSRWPQVTPVTLGGRERFLQTLLQAPTACIYVDVVVRLVIHNDANDTSEAVLLQLRQTADDRKIYRTVVDHNENGGIGGIEFR